MTSFDFQGQVETQSMYLVIIGCAIIVLGYMQIALWGLSGERQTRTIRQTLFRAIIRKEMVYFDTHKTGELSTKLTDDVNKIQDGIGDKIGSAAQFIASFFTGLIIGQSYLGSAFVSRAYTCLGFIKGWKLTLVILSISPLLFVSALLFSKVNRIDR
jgi:ABC-type multidrug transport system fused ATPase/permease subunit